MSARDGMRGVSPSPKVTPPGSLIELPPSPPSTGRSAHALSRSRLAASVRRIQTEPIEGGRIKLSPGDFSTALDYLRESDPDTWGHPSPGWPKMRQRQSHLTIAPLCKWGQS
ncbi:hypothetical protein V501_00258 [Pseudogymnoascus sp. VKM F-4519 (FW-2642)]|nr:hypothetical protein V501_00258 [Pseudogymnoascus sp. VKM F-4519 (FW-2642)]